MKQLPKLYNYTTSGQLQEWSIELDGDKYRTHSGIVGGAITTSKWTTCKGKNVGKANETTSYEQAFFDAKSKWTKKYDNEQYRESESDLNTLPRYTEPMLAQNYVDRKHTINFSKERVFLQSKANGMRLIAKKEGLFSRKGKKVNSMPHIEKALKPLFNEQPNLILDGEAYNYNLRTDLGSFISIISKKNVTQEHLDYSEKHAQFWIYDVVNNSTYEQRNQLINNLLLKLFITNPYAIGKIVQMPTYEAKSHADVDKFLKYCEKQDEEGCMIRLNNAPYEHKRSSSLLKYKSWIYEEYKCIGMDEGTGNLEGCCGAFICVAENGNVFKSTPIGTHDLWRQYWKDRAAINGKLITIKFKELTPEKDGKGGVPNFGKAVAVRDYE